MDRQRRTQKKHKRENKGKILHEESQIMMGHWISSSCKSAAQKLIGKARRFQKKKKVKKSWMNDSDASHINNPCQCEICKT